MSLSVTMALAVIAVVLALSLKTKSPEISALMSTAVCLLLLETCVSRIGVILTGLRELTDKIQIESTYLMILLKLIGIAYVCEFAANISRDAGYSAVSSQIELLGKLTMLTVSLPVFLQVVRTIVSLL